MPLGRTTGTGNPPVAEEKIVQNLQQAVERLHDDIARVELWADALGCFVQPIPDYEHGQTKFDLPAATAPKSNPQSRPVAKNPVSNPEKREQR